MFEIRQSVQTGAAGSGRECHSRDQQFCVGGRDERGHAVEGRVTVSRERLALTPRAA